jgi:parvulin-like peptidyl-prolyl isomerase
LGEKDMAKAKAKEPTRAATSRAARSRVSQADSERWNRLLIISGVVAIILLVAGILVYGWWSEEVQPLTETVVRVDDREISLGHLQRRVALSLEENSFLLNPESQQILLALPETTAVQIQREAKVLEAAEETGVTVTDEELEAAILQEIGITDRSDPLVVGEAIAEAVEASGLHQDEYFDMIRARTLEQKVQDDFTSKAPATEEQVKARWILAADETAAAAAIARLEDGEAFAEVARDVSTDTENAEQGGTVDWRIRGAFGSQGQAVEDFLFNAEVGQRSDPLQGTGPGFYIVELVDKEANRNLTDEQKTEYGSRELNEWLDEVEATHRVEIALTEEDILRVLQDAVES